MIIRIRHSVDGTAGSARRKTPHIAWVTVVALLAAGGFGMLSVHAPPATAAVHDCTGGTGIVTVDSGDDSGLTARIVGQFPAGQYCSSAPNSSQGATDKIIFLPPGTSCLRQTTGSGRLVVTGGADIVSGATVAMVQPIVNGRGGDVTVAVTVTSITDGPDKGRKLTFGFTILNPTGLDLYVSHPPVGSTFSATDGTIKIG